jgi:transposase
VRASFGRPVSVHGASSDSPLSLQSAQPLPFRSYGQYTSRFLQLFLNDPLPACVQNGVSTATTIPAVPRCKVAELPDDPVVLKRMIEELLDALKRRDHDLEHVRARLDQLLRRLYGPRAERLDPQQLLLFAATVPDTATADTTTPAADAATATPSTPEEAAGKQRHNHGRQRPPAHLERRRCVHELTEAERLCPCCGQPRQVIGEEVSEQYDLVPQSVHVLQHVRLKYACHGCEQHRQQQPAVAPSPEPAPTMPPAVEAATPDPVVGPATALPSTLQTAPLPRQGLPRCLAAPGLLAYVILSKFGDHLPLYRLEQIFARQGVRLARSTLCDWLKSAADQLTPLYRLMLKDVLCSLVVQSDDTPVPVQHGMRVDVEDNRDGRLWVYSGDVHHANIVYSYSPNHEQSWPLKVLGSYKGFLQADGYPGYNSLYATENIFEVGCWAHGRRGFFDAQATDPTRALYVLGVIRQLYAIEKRLRQENTRLGLSVTEYWALRLRWRQEQSVPLLTALGQWLEKEHKQVLPKSPIGEAITYALNQWQALLRYTTRGFLEIDNNAAERALRAVAVGRKNYLFFGSDVGGTTAAVLYSLVQSCKRQEIEPWRYLRDVLERVPNCPVERLEELLPASWAAAQRAAAEAAASAAATDSS